LTGAAAVCCDRLRIFALRTFGLTVLARVQSLLGVVPLSAFVLLHAYGQLPALDGREAWTDDAVHTALAGWLLALVLLAFAAHAVLGLLRLRREPPPAGDLRGPPGLRALQAATGIAALGFVVYHVVSLGVLDSGAHIGVRTPYARLWNELGRPRELAIYLIGVAAVCLHLGHGLSRAAVSWRLARSERALFLWRMASGAFGLVLFCLFVQVLSHFAIGTALVER
jgi:succinate dehydrogenase / fumarate reductase cytochrome b subunit